MMLPSEHMIVVICMKQHGICDLTVTWFRELGFTCMHGGAAPSTAPEYLTSIEFA